MEVEFRHASWNDELTFAVLKRHGAAYCVMSGAGLPCVLRATADFVYVRLHGPDTDHLYAGSFSEDDLRWWGDRVTEWREQGREVFVYFNNDGYGHAVHNALRLKKLVQRGNWCRRKVFGVSDGVSMPFIGRAIKKQNCISRKCRNLPVLLLKLRSCLKVSSKSRNAL